MKNVLCLTIFVIHLAIHYFIFQLLSVVRLQWQQPKQRGPDFPFLSYFVQLFQGDPKVFPVQWRYNLFGMSWVSLRVSYWTNMS